MTKDSSSEQQEILGSLLSRIRRFLLAQSNEEPQVVASPSTTESIGQAAKSITARAGPPSQEDQEALLGTRLPPGETLKPSSPSQATEQLEKVPEASPASVRDLVLASESSVRLRNVAVTQQLFQDWTIRSAQRDLNGFERLSLELPNLGRKSVDELLDLLRNSDPDLIATCNSDAPAVNVRPQGYRGDLSTDVLRTPLAVALRHFGASGRLENAIIRAGFDQITIEQYLENPKCLTSALRSQQGVGRKTIVEAVELIEAYILVATEGGNIPNDDQGVNSAPSDELTALAVAMAANPRLQDLVSALPERQRFVLVARYGLDGETAQTLQDIADRVHVTRERVRQIEAKAIRQLRVPSNRSTVLRFLREEADAIWSILAGGNDLLSQDELRTNPKRLEPWQRLAIDVAHDGLNGWLAEHAQPSGTSWIRVGANIEALDKTVKGLEALFQDRLTPSTTVAVASLLSAPKDQIEAAAEHSDNLAEFEGYLYMGRLGARTRRKIRLHATAREAFEDRLFDIASLAELYRRAHPDDDVSSRLFLMELEDSPHLFCRLFDGIWFALPADPAGQTLDTVPFERSALLRPRFDEGTIGAELARQLASGPRRHVDLRESVPATFGGRVAESSVGAILLSNPCFRRVAPGVFDIDRTADAYTYGNSLNSVFLDDRQARAYCLARHGGAPVYWYPAWGPDFELWLTRWARLKAESELYRSLLTVVEIHQWSAPEDEIRFWDREIEAHADWMLGSERRFELGRRFIEPRQFLATIAHLAFFGWTSWIAINRTTDARGDVHDAADILALLIKAGLVNAEADWQGPHTATGKARSLFTAACIEAHHNGDLDWERGVLAEIWSDLEAGLDRGDEGWVDSDEFARALVSWQRGEARTSKVFARTSTEPVDPDPIFETNEWDQLFS